MMPITFAAAGEENTILRIGGSSEVRRHLENLGFVPGGSATVISETAGNLIIKVKETRVALSHELAMKIMV